MQIAARSETNKTLLNSGTPMDRFRERHQRRGGLALDQRLFSNGAPDPAIAIFKRMDALETQMRYGRTGDRETTPPDKV